MFRANGVTAEECIGNKNSVISEHHLPHPTHPTHRRMMNRSRTKDITLLTPTMKPPFHPA